MRARSIDDDAVVVVALAKKEMIFIMGEPSKLRVLFFRMFNGNYIVRKREEKEESLATLLGQYKQKYIKLFVC